MWNGGSSVFVLTAFALGLGLSLVSAPKTLLCQGEATVVKVTYRDSKDVRAACTGARRAIEFLEHHGLEAPDAVVMRIVDKVKTISGIPIAAWFDPKTRVAYVSSRETLASGQLRDELFGLSIGYDLHASLFAHETAHAVIDHITKGDNPSVAAHEYIAFVVQIATLPQAFREQVLQNSPSEPYHDLAEVSDIYLAMAPNDFATKAYLHFRTTENKNALLFRLVHDARAVASSEWH